MVEMKSDKRSAFEGTRFQSEGTGFDRKQFDKTAFDDSSKSVEKTAWQNAKTYDGDMSTPEFAKQSSSFNRDQSDFTNRDYTTSSARENDHSEARGMDQQFEHTINDDVIRKREELARPKIISSQEEQARTIEEIRSMMGRED